MALLPWIAKNMPWTPIAQGIRAAQEQEFMQKYRQQMMQQQQTELTQQQNATSAAKGAWESFPDQALVTPKVTSPQQLDENRQAVAQHDWGMMNNVPQGQKAFWKGYSQADPVAAMQLYGREALKPPQEMWRDDTMNGIPGQRSTTSKKFDPLPQSTASEDTGPVKDALALGYQRGSTEFNEYIKNRTLPQRPTDLYATRTQQGGTFALPNGDIVAGEFTPNGGYGYRDAKNKLVPLPPGSRPTTPSTGGYLSPKDFLAKRNELLQEQQALQRLNAYGKSVGGMPTGIRNWAASVTAKFRTMLGSKELNPAEFARMTGEGQLQALLGLFRTDVVGPGVMTEFDAQRVLQALGGNVGALQNPQVVERLLSDLYADKMQRTQLLEMEINRNAPVFNAPPMEISAPPSFGGTGAPPAPDGQSQEQPPPGVDASVWQFMTPEERALWK
jgi:hypothetical protein